MKKTNILIILGLFVLLAGFAQPAYAIPLRSFPTAGGSKPFPVREWAQLNAAASKFEGLLNAYSANHQENIVEQLSTAANDLSSSLAEFNAALKEIYPTLPEEEQLAVLNVYQSLDLYMQDLAAKTNSAFGREVFRIEYGEPLRVSNSTTQGRFITIIDDLNSDL